LIFLNIKNISLNLYKYIFLIFLFQKIMKKEKTDKKNNYLFLDIHIIAENPNDCEIFIKNLDKQCEKIKKKKTNYFTKSINGKNFAIKIKPMKIEDLFDKKDSISNYFIWFLLDRNNYENFNYLLKNIINLNKITEKKPILIILCYYKGIKDLEVEDSDLDLLIERMNENYPYFNYTNVFNFDDSNYLTVILEKLENFNISSKIKSKCLIF